MDEGIYRGVIAITRENQKPLTMVCACNHSPEETGQDTLVDLTY